MSLILIQNILENADPYNFIPAGADFIVYDKAAEVIDKQLNKNLSLEEIQNIVWDAIYKEFCFCKITDSKEDFILDVNGALAILGTPDRFVGIAKEIRYQLYNV